MRRSLFVNLTAATITLTTSVSAHAQQPAGIAKPGGQAAEPAGISPASDQLVARRAAELLSVLAQGESAKRSFIASAWKLGAGESADDGVRDLDRLGFLLGKSPKIESIKAGPDGTASVDVVNAYGRRSVLTLDLETAPPHRMSIAGVDRTPLNPPLALRSPKSVSLATSIVSAPLSFIGGRPMVDVMIGDKGPYRFMLETGANLVMISPEVAAAAFDKLTPLTGDLMWDVDGRQVGSTYMLDELNIGGASFRQLGIMVTPKRSGEDGVLGLPAYRDLLMGLDLKNKKVTFQKGALPRPDGKEILALKPLGPLLAVDVKAGAKTVPFEIDTQADKSFFLATEVADGWKFSEPLVQVGTVLTAGGQHKAASMLGRLDGNLKLGKFTFRKPLIHVRDDPEDTIPPSGLLGVGALSEFVMVLDQKHNRVRFSRSGSPVIAPPPPYRSFGFGLSAGRKGGAKVANLEPGGAAAKAGLKEGDVVVKLGNASGKDIAGSLRNVAQSSEPVVVEVLRGDKPMTFSVQSQVLVK